MRIKAASRRLGLAALLVGAWTGVAGAQARLPNLRTSATTPCEIHPETAAETADLWSLARQTLESATGTGPRAASRRSPPTLLVQEWRRTLAPDFRPRYERRDTFHVTTLHPFEKSPPGNVDQAGYIQQRGWTTVFYGPDAGLLLSDKFLRRHCFRRIPGEGGSATAGLVGLAFDPLPKTRTTDVSGVLWIDPSGGLRHVEYVWINAPEEARAPGVGGRTDFVRLPSGGWIVQRWNIRMPRSVAGLTGMGRGDFDGYTDQGGEVLALSRPKNPR